MQDSGRRKKARVSTSKTATLAYKYLMQARDLDNNLIYTRSNILLVVQSGLLAFVAGSFAYLTANNPKFLVVLCIFGFIVAFFWWRIVKAGSYWVDHWESKLEQIEPRVLGGNKVFRDHPSRERDPVRKKYFKDRGYVSARKTIKYVAITAMILWLALLAFALFSPKQVARKAATEQVKEVNSQ
jgi:fatty acid desaturase